MIRHIHERLERWATWADGGRVGKSQGVSRYEVRTADSASDGLWSTRVPYDTLEAQETEDAVTALPAELYRVVKMCYVEMPGRTLKDQARALKIGSDQTLRIRIEHAHARIDAWLQDRHAAGVMA